MRGFDIERGIDLLLRESFQQKPFIKVLAFIVLGCFTQFGHISYLGVVSWWLKIQLLWNLIKSFGLGSISTQVRHINSRNEPNPYFRIGHVLNQSDITVVRALILHSNPLVFFKIRILRSVELVNDWHFFSRNEDELVKDEA